MYFGFVPPTTTIPRAPASPAATSQRMPVTTQQHTSADCATSENAPLTVSSSGKESAGASSTPTPATAPAAAQRRPVFQTDKVHARMSTRSSFHSALENIDSETDTTSASDSDSEIEAATGRGLTQMAWSMFGNLVSAGASKPLDKVNQGSTPGAAAQRTVTVAPTPQLRRNRSMNSAARNERGMTIDANGRFLMQQYRRRLLIASEILSTERSYVQSLDRVHQFIYRPLYESLWKNAMPVVRDKHVLAAVFSNFQDLRNVNTELLRQLEARLIATTDENGTPATAKDMPVKMPLVDEDVWDPAESKLGDVFLSLSPFLKMYSMYVRNFNHALKVLDHELAANPQFKKFIQTQLALPQLGSLTLQAYLIMPAQRIPRYRLLLTDLLHHTPKEHPDFENIQKALTMIESIADYVNEEIRKHEDFLAMVEVQHRLVGYRDADMNTNVIVPGRRLLKKGVLTKACRKDHQPRMFFLFNDCLIYASMSNSASYTSMALSALASPLSAVLSPTQTSPVFPRPMIPVAMTELYYFHRSLSVSSVRVVDLQDVPASEHEQETVRNAFLILSHEKSFQVHATTPSEKQAWITALRSAAQEALRLTDECRKSVLRPEISKAVSARSRSRRTLIPEPMTISNVQLPASLTSPTAIEYCAPVWVPDAASTACMICHAEFNVFRWRHHCRKCGHLCCHACSSRQFIVPTAQGERLERTCDPCYFEMFEQEIARQKERQAVMMPKMVEGVGLTLQSRPRSSSQMQRTSVVSVAARAEFQLSRKRSLSDCGSACNGESGIIRSTGSVRRTEKVELSKQLSPTTPWRKSIRKSLVPKIDTTVAAQPLNTTESPVNETKTDMDVNEVLDRLASLPHFEQRSQTCRPLRTKSSVKHKSNQSRLRFTMMMSNLDALEGACDHELTSSQDDAKPFPELPTESPRDMAGRHDFLVPGRSRSHTTGISLALGNDAYAIPSCQLCKAPFHSLLRWRHECQKCKKIVCSGCASRKKPLEFLFEDVSSRKKAATLPLLPATPSKNDAHRESLEGTPLFRVCDFCFYNVPTDVVNSCISEDAATVSRKTSLGRRRSLTASAAQSKAATFPKANAPRLGSPIRYRSIKRFDNLAMTEDQA